MRSTGSLSAILFGQSPFFFDIIILLLSKIGNALSFENVLSNICSSSEIIALAERVERKNY